MAEDARLIKVIDGYTEAGLTETVSYRTMSGAPQQQPLADILRHLFNHQTHHRGQLTTLLSQRGIDPGVTDLLWLPVAHG